MLTVQGAAKRSRKGRPGSFERSEGKAGPLQTQPGAAPPGEPASVGSRVWWVLKSPSSSPKGSVRVPQVVAECSVSQACSKVWKMSQARAKSGEQALKMKINCK